MPPTLSKEIEELIPEYHPMVDNPTVDEVLKLTETEDGFQQYVAFLNERARLIQLAEDPEKGDPYRYGWELPHYRVADRELKVSTGQYCGGGKRATKSERAAKRVVKAAMMLPHSKIWCFQGNDHTSKIEQQPLIWKYLPAEIKALNGRARHGWAKINYNPDIGFANRLLVLPNQSQIHFLTYNQDYTEYQGWKLGTPLNRELRKLIEDTPDLHNIGAWLDEDAPLPWVETVMTRCTSNNAVWLWTFSTMDGITPAVGTVTLGARTMEHARAELIPADQRVCDDCPPGHMPTVQRPMIKKDVSIVYFWTQWNPFGSNYEGVKSMLEGKPTPRICQDAYGFSKDTKRRAYPLFGNHNIRELSELPEIGTNYQVVDLAGNRSWCCLYVRVVPGNPEQFWIYRDWPDYDTYAEWAVPGPTNEYPDGIQGPAQRGPGHGYGEYKRLFIDMETHRIKSEWLVPLRKQLPIFADDKEEAARAWWFEALAQRMPDRQVRRQAAELLAMDPDLERGEVVEQIFGRYIDPRAAKDEKHMESGSKTPQQMLAEQQRIRWRGETVIVPGLFYIGASGVSIDTGFDSVNTLLAYDTTQEIVRITNEPRLYVTANCQQVIKCLFSYTGLGGEKGGWKDISDLVRYMATSPLCYAHPEYSRSRRPLGGH